MAKKKKILSLQRDTALITKQILRKMEKFYLVGITGRTSFILENLKGTKFKITIGNQLKCSCSIVSEYHCVHTLYVLTSIFHIPEDHPLLHQSKYIDKQLRYIIANRRIYCNKILDFLKYVKKKVPKQNIILQQQDEDDMQNLCAICHMQIVKCDATTTCATVCRNTFHLDCFSQWMKHELKNNGIVKCPLCRDQKTEDLILQIRQKEYQLKESINTKKVGVCYNYYCDGCQLKQIQESNTVYKCVACQDVTLCENCFKTGKHIKHGFICKLSNQKKWRECQDRNAKKKLDAESGYIRMKLPMHKKFYNFLACTLPSYFSKNNRWNIVECKKLDIKIQELQCICCSDPQKSFLRKLPCGHFIHHKCLRKRIQKGKLYCKHDGQKFLAGYESLVKHQELNRKVEFDHTDEVLEQQQEYKQDKMSNSLSNSKTLKTLGTQKSTSCDSRSKKYRNKSKNDRNRSLISKFKEIS